MLMLCLAIAFALPLLQVPAEFSLRKVNSELSIVNGEKSVDSQQSAAGSQQPTVGSKQSAPVTKSPVQSPATENAAAAQTDASKTASTGEGFSMKRLLNWMIGIYWFGVIVFAASFLFQVIVLLYRAYRNPYIMDGRYRIVEVSGDKAPCSFGNIIFINPAKYEWEIYNQIIEHEKVHIRQNHTLDILIAELVLIFQWFNPFAWIYRREIENNLEFLTDDQLMQQKNR